MITNTLVTAGRLRPSEQALEPMGSLSVTLRDNLRVLKGWKMEEEVVRRKGGIVLGFQASLSCSCWQSGVRRVGQPHFVWKRVLGWEGLREEP